MKRPNRTTAIRVLAVAGLVVLARSLTPGEQTRSEVAPAPATRTATMRQDATVRETPGHAAHRILAEYARYPSLAPGDAEAALRDLASEANSEALVGTLQADLGRLAAGYPGGTTRLWVGPLATRATEVDAGKADVKVWFCRVVAPPGKPVYAEWRLGAIDLVWEREAWRLNGFEENPGPRPLGPPGEATTPASFLPMLEGFDPTWP